MGILLIIIALPVLGWFIGKWIASFIANDKTAPSEKPSLTIHNHIHETHNHLHIDKKTLKELTGRKQ